MTAGIIHKMVSVVPDGPDTGVVRPSDWNEEHVVVGYITEEMAIVYAVVL